MRMWSQTVLKVALISLYCVNVTPAYVYRSTGAQM